MYRIKGTINGRVQGVGFRFFVQYNALNYSLTGYAKNLPNGSVLIEVQGLRHNIDKLLELIRKGNKFIKVTHTNIEEIDPILNEKGFKIL